MNEFLVITGLSGGGRSQVADTLEDLGWFVIDNIPTELISKVAELAQAPGSTISRVALVVSAKGYTDEIPPLLADLRKQGERVQVLFLDASKDALVRRYEQTRRVHPFDRENSLGEAIEAERAALDTVRTEADIVIDTSDLNVHQLRDRVIELFGDESSSRGMRTGVMSFGFKHGLPNEVDLVLDCRFLPNPHWVEDLRPQTGLDAPVRDYVMNQPATGAFLERLEQLLALLMPSYVKEGKAYLTIAFGCTGGRHRSVAIAEHIGAYLERTGFDPVVTHRDVEK